MSDVFRELVPELMHWNNGQGIGLLEWLSGVGSIEQAIAYSTLFWPEFFERDGCVFLKECSEDTYQEWLLASSGDKSRTERSMNHQHPVDLFVNANQRPTETQIQFLGQKMKEMLEAKLARDFPTRKFSVIFSQGADQRVETYSLTFFQPRA